MDRIKLLEIYAAACNAKKAEIRRIIFDLCAESSRQESELFEEPFVVSPSKVSDRPQGE